MRRGRRQLLVLLALSAGLALSALPAGAQSAQAGTPTPIIGPTRVATPAPQNATTTIIQHRLLFPAETITESLVKIFSKGTEGIDVVNETAKWGEVMGAIFQPPANGDYAKKAQSSWPVAAVLAPALFVLRIAFYNWRRLTGEEDSAARSAGDILTALVLAVLCGWFLDLVVRMGWGITGAVVGETAQLARDFLRTMTLGEVGRTVAVTAALGIFAPLFSAALTIGAIIGLAGVLMSFFMAQGALYVLAILGPAVMIAGVLPELRFLRAFWLKGVVLIALLPLLAGGIFKATVEGSAFASGELFSMGIILGPLIRVLWLWAAAGAMLAVVGILGKFTITTTADAANKVFGAVKGIATTAALAATGAGIGTAGMVGAAGGGMGATGAGAAGGTGGAGSPGGPAALSDAQQHLGSAQQWNFGGMMADVFGQRQAGQFARSMASQHTLAARQAELGLMMERFGAPGGPSGDQQVKAYEDVGFTVSESVRGELLKGYGSDDPAKFKEAYEGLSPLLQNRSIDPGAFASQNPNRAGLMASIYQNEREAIDRSGDPLGDLALRAGFDQGLFDADG